MTLTIDKPENINYAAAIIKLGNPHDLAGLDNLHGFTVLGLQALTEKTHQAGELMVAFTAETQLSDEFARMNNLHRHGTLNANPGEKGYLEDNRRVRAIRLKKHASHAIILPLSSLAYTGANIDDLQPGMQFDTLNGREICRKYVRPGSNKVRPQQVAKKDRRVPDELFPLHIDTAQYARAFETLRKDAGELIVTQKLHGTSIRVGNIPVRRRKNWFERQFSKLFATPDFEYDNVYGSRRVTKDANDPAQNHFYDTDIWTHYGRELDDTLPHNVIVYGELIGWSPDGAPLQSGYTYDLPVGQARLYIYRVAVVNENGYTVDLSWDGVKQFCAERGLRHVPEFRRISADMVGARSLVDEIVGDYLNIGYQREWEAGGSPHLFAEKPVPLSDPKSVDEGICIRQEGLVPTILKAKSPLFFEYETKQLDDQDAVDIESDDNDEAAA